ncbi:MAG: hypothetical protein R3D25_18550 [Geminicoccaceae bacterium]
MLALTLAMLPLAGGDLAAEPVKAEWWHAMRGRLTPIVDEMIANFNAGQDKYEIVGVLKGNYEETAAAMVAAYRVNEHPDPGADVRARVP